MPASMVVEDDVQGGSAKDFFEFACLWGLLAEVGDGFFASDNGLSSGCLRDFLLFQCLAYCHEGIDSLFSESIIFVF